MTRLRIVIGAAGLVVGLYGVLLLTQRAGDLVNVGVWLAGGVLTHDAVLAPIVIGICLIVAKVLPSKGHRTAAVVLVIFGSVSLVAIPVLGKFGAKSDNPTLLDRNYVLGWLLLAALIVSGTIIIEYLTYRRTRVASATEQN